MSVEVPTIKSMIEASKARPKGQRVYAVTANPEDGYRTWKNNQELAAILSPSTVTAESARDTPPTPLYVEQLGAGAILGSFEQPDQAANMTVAAGDNRSRLYGQ